MLSAYRQDTFFLNRALPVLIGLAAIYGALWLFAIPVNAVVLAITLMVVFCLIKIPVAVSLVSAALLGGLHARMTMPDILQVLNDNLLSGAQVGMTYIMVGAFAVALARSGILDWVAQKMASSLNREGAHVRQQVKWMLFALFIVASLLSQNLIPVHIAFIPVLIPPLLGLMNRLRLDRRAVACILACGISASYLLLPFGFGAIYLNEILLENFNSVGAASGYAATASMAPKAMFFPVMGLLAGMLFAVFITYRKPRDYIKVTKAETENTDMIATDEKIEIGLQPLLFTALAVVTVLLFQIYFDSLFIGAMIGFMILGFSGIYRWQAQDDVFTQGVRLMAEIAVIITIASSFGALLTATGDIDPLVASATQFFGDNKLFGAAVMLVVGLFITIGFGDSFASVPILAPIYIPLAFALGFSPLAALAMLGAAAALGDAGSPASTITLGATAGLNADGQHDHIKDSVIPTFFHANIGMLLFTWVAVVWLLG
ncbi:MULTISPECIES: Na+/H+ antiporter NhaC family protein [Psychrobacter]|uniref:Na+ antiporter NhaC n=1 Tax=Psychrobacter alimentarius TaxID=261164 RepID=A0ABM6A0T4_9GAMM|nr:MULTISPECIES: Na+/H+ antiporter NhaC family protein [Psychrobacter]AMT97957.1 Na+ antiporter NhaC [Psychrobacter alimentarius]QCB29767.1 TRAP transporter large permease subunit [Psychrobacter sp. PAMC27889]